MARVPLSAKVERVNPSYASRHLFVDDTLGNAVYEFPLGADGFPKKVPDVKLSGFNYPVGIAIGPDGDLYVSDTLNLVVKVFLPGAGNAATPVRVLNIPNQPYGVAVDQRGYLAVTVSNLYVLVYRPNASGSDPPILKIDPRGIDAIAYGPNSELYYMTGIHGIGVLGPLPFVPTQRWILPTQQEGLFRFAMTVHDDQLHPLNDELYAEYHGSDTSEIVRIAAIEADHGSGMITPDREIVTPACHGQRNRSAAVSYGLAVLAGRLFEACTAKTTVFVFDALHGGTQQPLAGLRGPFLSVNAIAIGP